MLTERNLNKGFTLDNFLFFMEEDFDRTLFEEKRESIPFICPIAQFSYYLYGRENVYGAGFGQVEFNDNTFAYLPQWASAVARRCMGDTTKISNEDIINTATGVVYAY